MRRAIPFESGREGGVRHFGSTSTLEQRVGPRYAAMISIQGSFGAADGSFAISVQQVFRLNTQQRIPLRTERLLRFVYPRSFPAVYGPMGIPDRDPETNYAEFRCSTVWSHLHSDTTDGLPAYRSGIAVEKNEPAAALLPFVLRDFVCQDKESLQRRRQQWREREVKESCAPGVADHNLLVRTAAEHFRTHPAEAYPWYRRARYALSSLLSLRRKSRSGLHGRGGSTVGVRGKDRADADDRSCARRPG